MIGLKDTTTGDTLSDPNQQVVLESMTFPDPVIEVAIEPKTKSDQEKLSLAIQKLAEEDPTFKVHQDNETGQTVIGGMGELHLDILVDRMRREFKVEATSEAAGGYKETIKREVRRSSSKEAEGSSPVRRSSTPPRARRSGWASCSRCTPTRRTRSSGPPRGTSMR